VSVAGAAVAVAVILATRRNGVRRVAQRAAHERRQRVQARLKELQQHFAADGSQRREVAHQAVERVKVLLRQHSQRGTALLNACDDTFCLFFFFSKKKKKRKRKKKKK
jgi:hypothetical protein